MPQNPVEGVNVWVGKGMNNNDLLAPNKDLISGLLHFSNWSPIFSK